MVWSMMQWMRWLNRNVATINATLQFLDIYIYIYILFSYNSKIKVDEYVKLKPLKMNL